MLHSSYIKNNHGFSLLELMVVIVIIAVLAAVAIPIYGANIKKARQAEADAALGTIRTQLRIFYAEYAEYPDGTEDTVIDAAWSHFKEGELNGSYFSDESYSYTNLGNERYQISCAGGEVLDYDRTLDQNGNFGHLTLSGGFWAVLLGWLGWG